MPLLNKYMLIVIASHGKHKEEQVPYSMSAVLMRAHEQTRLKCEQVGPWMKGNQTLFSDQKYLIVNDTLVITNSGEGCWIST